MGYSTRTAGVRILLLGAVVAASLVGSATGIAGDEPLAEAGLDQRVSRGETVRLDATGSYDPGGELAAYEWRLRTPSGRTVGPVRPNAARTSFPATAVGRYEVTLTVTDDEGNTATDTMYVDVGPAESAAAESTPRGARSAPPSADVAVASSRSGPTCPPGRSYRPSVAACLAPGERPGDPTWARVDGPVVVKAENAYTYTAVTGGFGSDPTFEWGAGGSGRTNALEFLTRGEYAVEVTVSDGSGARASGSLDVFVAPADNERPDVEIVDPGTVSAGDTVTLSAEADDPDGRVVTTEWSPGRRVRVPTDGSARTVHVTITDDDGATVTDRLTLRGRRWNTTEVHDDTTDVTCYFTNSAQQAADTAERCDYENGDTAILGQGPSAIRSYERNPKVDLHWRRVSEAELQSTDAGEADTSMGVSAPDGGDDADQLGYSDDPVETGSAGETTDVENDETFALAGETVEDDLTGDGEVNAADWDLRHRTTGDLASDNWDRTFVGAYQRSVRGGGGGSDGGIDWGGPATARTIEGTSVDADNRRESFADLSGGGSSTADDGGDQSTDGSSSSGGDRRPADGPDGRRGSSDGDSSDGGGASGGASSPVDGGPSTDASPDDEGSDEEKSRHVPQGGRIVAFI